MLSALISFATIAAMIIPIAYPQATTTNPCDARVSAMSLCHLSVSVDQQCQSAILRFPETNFTNSCDSAEIFWHYPMNNLTFIIDTPFTARRQPYRVQLDVQSLKSTISRVFQVQPNGMTTELDFQSDTITVESDSKFRVGLKFEVPSRFIVYGVSIRYKVVRV